MAGLSRRDFMASSAGAAALASTAVRAAEAIDTPWAGEKVVDCHFHGRPTDAGIIAHLDGAGISNTLILAAADYAARMPTLNARYPGRVLGWARGSVLLADDPKMQLPVPVDPRAPNPNIALFVSAADQILVLRRAIREGAKGFGETAGLVYADGPELQRLYALASELDVPVMMHFQQGVVENHPRYGISGYSRIEAMLKKYPKTRFICHASDFWGHIDANFVDGADFVMSGKITPGGLTDRLLADYPNMYGDLGAPSGMIQMSRDPEFTAGFMRRHQDKLIFGSDCACIDGRGATSEGGGSNAVAVQMAKQRGYAGKCVAREILGILWRGAAGDRALFRKLVWQNGHRVYKLPA